MYLINFHFFVSLNLNVMSVLFLEPFVFVGAVTCFKMHGEKTEFSF